MKLKIRESIDKIKTFSRTFVERPRFAMVIAVVLSIAGMMAMLSLPIAQYPQLTISGGKLLNGAVRGDIV